MSDSESNLSRENTEAIKYIAGALSDVIKENDHMRAELAATQFVLKRVCAQLCVNFPEGVSQRLLDQRVDVAASLDDLVGEGYSDDYLDLIKAALLRMIADIDKLKG